MENSDEIHEDSPFPVAVHNKLTEKHFLKWEEDHTKEDQMGENVIQIMKSMNNVKQLHQMAYKNFVSTKILGFSDT